MCSTERYREKYFSVLGDSISTLDGYSQPSDMAFYAGMEKFKADVFSPEDTWWGRVIDALGARLLINNSISGSTVCKHPAYDYPSYSSSDERTSALSLGGVSPDVIMVFMGTNDWGCGMRPVPSKEGEGESLSVFSVAYGKMLDKLSKNYPSAQIWCFTVPVGKCTAREGFSFPYRYRGIHLDEYCEVIRTVAAAHSCRIIDLNRTAPPHDTIDGFHPNNDGMKTLAEAVLASIL